MNILNKYTSMFHNIFMLHWKCSKNANNKSAYMLHKTANMLHKNLNMQQKHRNVLNKHRNVLHRNTNILYKNTSKLNQNTNMLHKNNNMLETKWRTKKLENCRSNTLDKTSDNFSIANGKLKTFRMISLGRNFVVFFLKGTTYYGLLKVVLRNKKFSFLISVIVNCLNSIVLIHNPQILVLDSIVYSIAGT